MSSAFILFLMECFGYECTMIEQSVIDQNSPDIFVVMGYERIQECQEHGQQAVGIITSQLGRESGEVFYLCLDVENF